ncbi:hypothetical protein F8388_009529 [Cannabis sativa]|uniref:Biotin carboxyl carrier protein of acetyl-CoA carboxylase n=1 Tax=Cannabis sativa TaxID=3483 RepID=A0A7J6H753_CANSA|nr:hypothetical protein F8388_009529 [Cannabis sativa]
MASSSLATASAVTKSTTLHHCHHNTYRSCPPSKVSFHLSHKPKLRFVTTKGLQPSRSCSIVVKAHLNEVRFFNWISLEDVFSNFHSMVDALSGSFLSCKVALDGSSNAAPSPLHKSDPKHPKGKDAKPSSKPSSSVLATEESISEFISQVASLVKLVDSRDIVELKLKQLDCEVVIRKKEALPQPPPPPPPAATYQALPPAMAPPAPSAPAPAPALVSSPPPPAAPAAPKSTKSSLPPLKCPMAGTFYRSPGPGEPPFVKVGDKVQKGQVLCIIEAMKLMNEIEADQSGTIVEVVAEDGKPVSVDTQNDAVRQRN